MSSSSCFSAKNQPRKRKGAKIGRKYKGVSDNKKFAAAARVARSPIYVNEDGNIICKLKFKGKRKASAEPEHASPEKVSLAAAKQALDIFSRLLGHACDEVVNSLANIVEMHSRLGNLSESEKYQVDKICAQVAMNRWYEDDAGVRESIEHLITIRVENKRTGESEASMANKVLMTMGNEAALKSLGIHFPLENELC